MKARTRKPARPATTTLGVALLAAGLAVGVAEAQVATVVRGRIERATADGTRYAVANVEVVIQDSATARRWHSVYTGRDGLFYLDGIPEGIYYLEIRVSQGLPPSWYKIRAKPQPYTDLAPILVN